MVKLIAFLTPKPGMTLEQFKVRWVDEHTKISSKMPGLKGYRININQAVQPDNAEPNYHGTSRTITGRQNCGGIASRPWKPPSPARKVSLPVRTPMSSANCVTTSIPTSTLSYRVRS